MLCQNGGNVQELALHDVVVPDVGEVGGLSLTGDNIDTIALLGALVGLNDLEEDVLLVETGVLGEGAGDDEKGIGEGVHTELGLT